MGAKKAFFAVCGAGGKNWLWRHVSLPEFSLKDFSVVAKILLQTFRVIGFAIILPMLVAMYYGETGFVVLFAEMALGIIVFCSAAGFFIEVAEPKLKHGVVAVALAWIILSLVSSLPFMAYGMSPVDSFFESVSGWTGTGLTMVQLPQSLPFALNFWRGFIQWVGGFGIVILALLILEKPRVARNLMAAEGRSEDFYLNAVTIARAIAGIYLLYTALGIIGFMLVGMNLFDAVVHTFTTLATGGYSTQSAGLGFFGHGAMIVGIFLMCAGGINYVSHRALLKRRFKDFASNPEIKFFFGIILVAMLLVSVNMILLNNFVPLDQLFYIVSAITGTGATTFFQAISFGGATIFILILLMIFGACYGSTTGALKLWRVILVLKIFEREIRKIFLPQGAITPLKSHGACIDDEKALNVIAYICLYLLVLAGGAMVFMFFGFSIVDSIFTVASAQGNVGLATIGGESWFLMNPLLKILLSIHMLVGRIEILPFFVLIKALK